LNDIVSHERFLITYRVMVAPPTPITTLANEWPFVLVQQTIAIVLTGLIAGGLTGLRERRRVEGRSMMPSVVRKMAGGDMAGGDDEWGWGRGVR